jgi:hypothetical protein
MTKAHYYSFVVVIGNEDSHIVPHPTKKDAKNLLIPRLTELAEQLEEEIKHRRTIRDVIKK